MLPIAITWKAICIWLLDIKSLAPFGLPLRHPGTLPLSTRAVISSRMNIQFLIAGGKSRIKDYARILRVSGLNKKEMTMTSLFHLTALNEPSSCLLQALVASKVLAASLLSCIIQGAWCKPSGIHGASLVQACWHSWCLVQACFVFWSVLASSGYQAGSLTGSG